MISGKNFLYFVMVILFQCNVECQISGTTVTDIEGNEYESIVLANGQEWLTSNLRSTKFNDGTDLSLVIANGIWSTTPNPSYCYYDNDPAISQNYGCLYNFFVVSSDKNICPEGWRVPTELDWSELTSDLGGLGLAGGKLKAEGFNFWSSPNTDATNEIRFNALPNGCRYDGGYFNNLNYYSFFWTASELDTTFAWYRSLKYDNGSAVRNFSKKQSGYGIRCMRNNTSELPEIQEKSGLLYPNPTRGIVTFQLPSDQITNSNFTITDHVGRIVHEGILTENRLDFTSFQQGYYFIILSNFKKKYIFNVYKSE